MPLPPSKNGDISSIFETVGTLADTRNAAAAHVNSSKPDTLEVNCNVLSTAQQAVLAADQEAAKIPQMSAHLSNDMTDQKTQKAVKKALSTCKISPP